MDNYQEIFNKILNTTEVKNINSFEKSLKISKENLLDFLVDNMKNTIVKNQVIRFDVNDFKKMISLKTDFNINDVNLNLIDVTFTLCLSVPKFNKDLPDLSEYENENEFYKLVDLILSKKIFGLFYLKSVLNGSSVEAKNGNGFIYLFNMNGQINLLGECENDK